MEERTINLQVLDKIRKAVRDAVEAELGLKFTRSYGIIEDFENFKKIQNKTFHEYKDQKDSTSLNVIFDPRNPKTAEMLIAQRQLLDDLTSDLDVLYKGTQRLIESKKTADKISAQIKGLKGEKIKELQKAVKTIQDSIKNVQDNIFGKENPKAQGITSRDKRTVTQKVFEAMWYINSRPEMPTSTEERLVAQAKSMIKEGVDEVNESVRDTLIDLINYAVYGVMLLDNTWDKEEI